MKLNRKASLLFLISFLLYIALSVVISVVLVFVDTPAVTTGSQEEAAATAAYDGEASGAETSSADEEEEPARLTDMGILLNAVFISIPAFLIPAILFRKKNGFPAFKAPGIGYLVLAVIIGLGCVLLNDALSCLSNFFFYDISIESNATSANTIKGLNTWNMLFSLAIIPPLSEEFLMRGALLETWRRYSPIGAAFLTSLLFALLHMAPSAFLIYFGIGMLLACVYLITRNIWLTVTVHLVNNLASVVTALSLARESEPAEEAASQAAGTAVDGFSAFLASRWGSLFMFMIFAGAAAAVLVPSILGLRGSYRRRQIGAYAVEIDPELSEIEALDPLPIEVMCAEAGEKRAEMWRDVLLWIIIAVLLIVNVISGLFEFGVIKIA